MKVLFFTLVTYSLFATSHQLSSCFQGGPSVLKVGGSYSYVSMKPSGFSPFEGSLSGSHGVYEYRPNNSIYAATSLNWRQGNTSQGKENRFLLDIDAQERVGFTFKPNRFDLKISFFTGFGFRLLNHHLTQPKLDSIRFKYQEFYVPL